jgi:hypothetical protein
MPPKKTAAKQPTKQQQQEEEEQAAKEAAEFAALQEERRAEEERLKKEQDDNDAKPIEVPRFGTGDVRGMLVRNFQGPLCHTDFCVRLLPSRNTLSPTDLYAQPNFGIPPEDEDGSSALDAEGEEGKEELESGDVAEADDALRKKNAQEVNQRILDRTGLIHDRLESRLMEVVQLEDYIINRTHVMQHQENVHDQVMREHGLFPGTDVPLGPTYFKIDKRALESNTLIDLENIMSGVRKEKLDEMLQRVPAKPPRDGTKSRRRQEQEQQNKEHSQQSKVRHVLGRSPILPSSPRP